MDCERKPSYNPRGNYWPFKAGVSGDGTKLMDNERLEVVWRDEHLNQKMEPPYHTVWDQWSQRRQIKVVFQPIVSLRTGAVLAFEGLSRPQSDGGEPIEVSALIASAEQHGHLLVFDEVAFGAVLQAATRVGFGPDHLLFINILPNSLEHPLPFLRHLQQHPVIEPRQIVLEISERETVTGGDRKLQEYLEPFREMGVRIALDDLGSGYSGLNRLVDLQPDFAKIDLSLVRDVDRNSIKFALLESTARFASRTAATSLIAEGIETFAELYTLKEIGVEYGQGYLLGRPHPAFHTALEAHHFASRQRVRPTAQDQLDSLLSSARRMVRGMAQGEGRYTHLLALSKRLTGADVAALYNADGEGLHYFESTLPLNPQEVTNYNRLINSESPSLLAALHKRKPVIFQRAASHALGPSPQHSPLESQIAVPVCDNLGCWGLLHLGYYEPDQIRPDVIQLAEGVASLFALALGYAEREESLEDQSLLGEPLFEAISALADTANLDHLLAKAVAAALAVTGGHEGWIGILQAQQLHCVTADGQRFDLPAADLWDPSTQDGQGPVGLIVRNQQALIIPNIASEPMLNPWLNEMLDSGIKSAAGFPLMSQGELLGILKVYHSQIGGFTPGRIRRLQALSSLATALIERSLSTLASEAHARRQEIMARGLAAMNTLDTRDDLVQLLVATVSDFGPYPFVSIVEQHQGHFVPLAIQTPSPDYHTAFTKHLSTPLYQKALEQALKTGIRQPLVLSDDSSPDALKNPACCSAIPLPSHNLVLVIGSATPGTLSPHLAELDSYVVSLASALDRNLLQQQVSEAQQETNRLLTTIKTLPQATTIQELWQQIAGVLLTHLRANGGWIAENATAPHPLACFGLPIAPHWIPPTLLSASPVAMHGPDIPAQLEQLGIHSLVGFRLHLASEPTPLFMVITSSDTKGFSSSQIRRFEILVAFAQANYEILRLRARLLEPPDTHQAP
ncbi:hypothetical protein CO251_02985 [Sulfobacillus sp. hq2]|nr:hypothetical protein CO251_02985 [Sulfobacillus sp. hq2]